MRRPQGYVRKSGSHTKKNRYECEAPVNRGSLSGPRTGALRTAIMKKRTLVWGALVVLVAAGGVFAATRGGWWPGGAVGQAPGAKAAGGVPFEVATAIKKTVPVRIEALGTVTPIASVAIKARIDSEIVGVHFSDGAMVREGEVLFTLDSRAVEAQIKQQQGLLEGAKANLEQAERDVARYTELLAKNATTQATLNNASTQGKI